MNSYNGFSPAQRNKSQAWLRKQWQAGTLLRPSICHACGQTEGIIDAHAEDYSEPFMAGKTDEFHLCRRCHMMVHRRFKFPDGWKKYKAFVANGGRYLVGGKNTVTQGAPPDINVLDIIDAYMFESSLARSRDHLDLDN